MLWFSLTSKGQGGATNFNKFSLNWSKQAINYGFHLNNLIGRSANLDFNIKSIEDYRFNRKIKLVLWKILQKYDNYFIACE